MVCRSKERGEAALSTIQSTTGNPNIHLEVFHHLSVCFNCAFPLDYEAKHFISENERFNGVYPRTLCWVISVPFFQGLDCLNFFTMTLVLFCTGLWSFIHKWSQIICIEVLHKSKASSCPCKYDEVYVYHSWQLWFFKILVFHATSV